ncbi:MAG: glycosyltransferase family 2 protein [Chloroflexota bacterium]|nr:glycosyltransferase family 2 protein [Chloroflexota bacterium]
MVSQQYLVPVDGGDTAVEQVQATGAAVVPSRVAPPREVSDRPANGSLPTGGPAVTPIRPGPAVRTLSVVIPCQNEEGNLRELYRQLVAALTPLGLPFEVIVIDDGSTDGTWAVVEALHAEDDRVRGIRHRRNFGKAEGLANGFAVARGDVIITMDGDIQDDPVEIPNFLAKIDEGFDLVSGWKQRRQDPMGKTLPSRFFNRTVRAVSGVPLHDFNCGFKAYRQEVTRSLRLYGELHRFTPVLAAADGFSIAEVPVKHNPRTWGRSKYGWSRLVKGFLDLLTVTFLTQYRQRPMHLLGLPGLVALALGVVIGLYLSAEKVIFGTTIGQRPLLLLAVLLVVIGAQFFGLGLIGELLAHGSNAPRTELRAPVRDTLGLDERMFGTGSWTRIGDSDYRVSD